MDWKSTSIELTSSLLGARVIFATDEWFAIADNLLNPNPPTFDPNAYCSQGKVMDGWESRRRREPGHDWAIIALPFPSTPLGIHIDTAFFTGNYVPRISVQGADLSGLEEGDGWIVGGEERKRKGGGVIGTAMTMEQVALANTQCNEAGEWFDILAMTPLRSGVPETRIHEFNVDASAKRKITHIRINYFPDGGVARLKLYGLVTPGDLRGVKGELSSVVHGGRGVGCTNQHFGVPSNLLRVNRGVDMGDGWETARHLRRPPIIKRDPVTGLVDTPLHDWAVLRMGCVVGDVERLVVDTKWFKGNFPESVSIDYVCEKGGLKAESCLSWKPLLKRIKMGPDAIFNFPLSELEITPSTEITHLKLSIFPDGGVSRIRLFGVGRGEIGEDQGGIGGNVPAGWGGSKL